MLARLCEVVVNDIVRVPGVHAATMCHATLLPSSPLLFLEDAPAQDEWEWAANSTGIVRVEIGMPVDSGNGVFDALASHQEDVAAAVVSVGIADEATFQADGIEAPPSPPLPPENPPAPGASQSSALSPGAIAGIAVASVVVAGVVFAAANAWC